MFKLKNYKLFFLSFIILLTASSCSKNDTKKTGPKTPVEVLVEKAKIARDNAYAPYSKYKVGAAIKSENGKIFTGANVENAAYGSTICAEKSALVSAITSGERSFDSIAIVTKDGGFPCGSCRQMLNELSPDIMVIIANEKGQILHKMKLSLLLPYAFGPNNLK